MDSSQNGINTIDLSDLSFGSNVDLTSSLTISSSSMNMGVTGANGPAYTISGVGTSPVWTTSSTGIDWISPSNINRSGTMELRGENADILVNGRSLMDAIDALEQRLNILVPNPELEAEWDELRELGERYRELEKKCNEKGEMWKKLKSMPPPETK